MQLAGTSPSQLPPVCADCQPELWRDDSHCSVPMPGIIGTHPLFPNFSPLFRHKYIESRRMAIEGSLLDMCSSVWVSTSVGKLLDN